jgi:hypothetical protein
MTKREMIDEIMKINHSAEPGFLADFNEPDLEAYLDHLHILQTPRMRFGVNPHRYDRYFVSKQMTFAC